MTLARRLFASALLLVSIAIDVPAQTDPVPPAAKPDASAGKPGAAGLPPKPDPTADPGVKKLSRREKRERMKTLSEKHQQFLKDVEHIIMPEELDTFLILESEPQRDLYIEQFWALRDPDPHSSRNEYRETYKELLGEAQAKFKYLSSDRAKVYLLRGRPNRIVVTECSSYLQPLEIWIYDRLEGMGRDIYLLFYQPRMGLDYRIWNAQEGVNVLMSIDGEHRKGDSGPFGQVTRGVTNVSFSCKDGDLIMRAIEWAQRNKFESTKLFIAPKVDQEDVNKILRTAVISNPNAPKLDATASVRFPGKRGGRTSIETTILVPKAQLTAKDINGTKLYNLDINGEILKDEKVFDTYHYRYDFAAETAGDNLPMTVERFLRPADYHSRVRVVDINSGAEAIVENFLVVPQIEDPPEKAAQEGVAAQTLDKIHHEFRSGESALRIVPMPEELLTGLQHIETIVSGAAITGVEFYLDGRKIMVKRNPPYILDLDLGDMPKSRKIKAVGVDDQGRFISGDEIIVNSGIEPFRVRIVSPRVAKNLQGKVRVQIDAKVPEGKMLESVQLYLNETPVATMFEPPFVQTIDVPANLGIGYLKAIATLKGDETIQPVEDMVFINSPEFMEEVDVHLIELPTTVIVKGKPINDLGSASFVVKDEGKTVKLAKFEQVKNLPLSIGMAVDTSASMRERMAEAQKAGAQFFSNVLKPNDRGFVVSFSSQAAMVQKWSRQLSDLNAALGSMRAEESTALYDAIVFSLYNFYGIKGQKALIVISDGKDTASKFTFDQAMEYARRAGVPIYPVGLGVSTAEFDTRFKLSRFAAETGGSVYYIERASDLSRIYDDIQNELRSQYMLGFYPPEGVKAGGKWREVVVEVREGKARTIRGYYP